MQLRFISIGLLAITLATTASAGLFESLDKALDKVQRALDKTQRVLDQGTKSIGQASTPPTQLMEEARKHHAAGRWTECIRACDRVLALDGNLVEARSLRADALVRLEREQTAATAAKAKEKAEKEAAAAEQAQDKHERPEAMPPLALSPVPEFGPLLRTRPEAGPAATLALLSLLGQPDPRSPLATAAVYPDAEDEAHAAAVVPEMLQFASARATGAVALAAADQAWQEAVQAASWGNEAAVQEALAILEQHALAAQSAEAAMQQVAERVKQLSAVAPDPSKRVAERRELYLKHLARTRRALAGAQRTSGWRLAERRNGTLYDGWSFAAGKGSRDTLTMVERVPMTPTTSITNSYRISWELPEAIVPGLPARVAMEGSVHTTAQHGGASLVASVYLRLPRGEYGVTGMRALYAVDSDRMGQHDPANTFELMIGPELRQLTPANFRDRKVKVRLPDPRRSGDFHNLTHLHEGVFPVPAIPLSSLHPVDQPLDGLSFEVGPAGPGPLRLEIRDHNDQPLASYRYVWSDQIVIDAEGEAVPLPLPLEKGKNSAIEFHEAAVTALERNLNRERAELARTTDPDIRARLQWRILHVESDLQAERDLLATLRTGVPVHTPGPFDQHARDLFSRQIRENQQRMESCLRAQAALPRLIGMLPPERQQAARDFVRRQLTPEVRASFDADKTRRIAEALHKQVDGYWRGESARHQEQALYFDDLLTRAERVKTIADVAISIGSGAGGLHTLRAAATYAGASGMVLGGPEQAVRDASLYLNAPLHAALSALEAYPKGGWTGAAQAGATGWLMSRLATLGTSAPAPVAGAEKMTVGQAIQLAEFRQAQQRGQDLAKAFQAAQAEVAAARLARRPLAEIGVLERKAADWAAAVHSDLHAKSFMKFKADLPLQKDFMAHVDTIHVRVEDEFHRIMSARQWDRARLQPVRNASSAGSPNMDYDIRLVEEAAARLTKGGRPQSLHAWQKEAQEAWDEAYRAVTGRSAGHAMEEITTSLHPEAYKDLAWITADKAGLSKLWATQAGDVTIYKGASMLGSTRIGAVDPLTRAMEAARGTAKDISTKVLDRLGAAGGSATRKAELSERWGKIRDLLKDVGEGRLDPVRGDRQLRSLTGGFGIPEVVEHAGILLGQAAKL